MMQYNNYYRGTFYGKPTASVMYELCVQLNKDSKEMLWWRIVGITDQQIHERLDMDVYNYEIVSCNNEVSKLIPSSNQDDEESKEEDVQDLFKKAYITHNREVGNIKSEPELKFMLLRHWTLFDSINNSNYMVAKFQLWKEPGQKQLRNFLANIGCPLDQAKQKFSFMDPDIKSQLKDKIMKQTENFNL